MLHANCLLVFLTLSDGFVSSPFLPASPLPPFFLLCDDQVAWYALNVQYNLYNKKILNVFPYPASCSLVQVSILPIPILFPSP